MLPVVYRKSGERSIVSYSYTDIAEGTGVNLFYGASHDEGGTQGYFLSINDMYSHTITTTGTAGGAGGTYDWTVRIDNDHDVVFNVPQSVKGKMRTNVFWGCVNGTGTGTMYLRLTVKLRKYDGSSETEIANAVTEEYITSPGTTHIYRENMEINVANLTHFKKGDILRVTIIIENKGASQTYTTTYGYSHDPQGRTDTSAIGISPTYLKHYIPFVLDL